MGKVETLSVREMNAHWNELFDTKLIHFLIADSFMSLPAMG